MSQRRVITNLALTIAFAVVCLFGLAYFASGMGMSLPAQSGYQLSAVFDSANGLVPQSEVRIAGVKVGHVNDIASTPDGKTLVTMTLDSDVHVRADSHALIRPKSPLGEKFVEIIRPADSNAGFLPAKATIPMSQTGQAVELDDALSNMDPQTREAMKTSLRELGVALDGRAADVNASIPQLDQTTANLRPLARIGQNRQQQIDRILTDLNTIMQSLADEHDSLAQIINSGDQTMSAIAARDRDLVGILQQLATFFTYLDQIFADLTPSDRASLEKSPKTLQAQLRMLGLTGPNVDKLIPEILLGEVNYPNNELSVTHRESQLLAMEWISNFWQVEQTSGDNRPKHALRIASNLQLLPSNFPAPPGGGASRSSNPLGGSQGGNTSSDGASAQGSVIDFMLMVPAR